MRNQSQLLRDVRLTSGQQNTLGLTYLTDVLEVLDIDSFCVHNFLDNVGSHLILVFGYFLAMLANICILFFILDTAAIFWHLFLINSQLQPEQTKQTGGKQRTATKPDRALTNSLRPREELLPKGSHPFLTERLPLQVALPVPRCVFKPSAEVSVWLNMRLSPQSI